MTVTTGVRARLYVDQALDAGRSVDLSANQSHYLNHVLRLGPGAEVALFNGKDGEWRARIETIRRNAGSLGWKPSHGRRSRSRIYGSFSHL